jgi:hypothetical protein
MSVATHPLVAEILHTERQRAFQQRLLTTGSLSEAARQALEESPDADFVSDELVRDRAFQIFTNTKSDIMETLGTPDREGGRRLNARCLLSAMHIEAQNAGLNAASRDNIFTMCALREGTLRKEMETNRQELQLPDLTSKQREHLQREIEMFEISCADLRRQLLLVVETDAARSAPRNDVDAQLAAAESIRALFEPQLQKGFSIQRAFAAKIAEESRAMESAPALAAAQKGRPPHPSRLSR